MKYLLLLPLFLTSIAYGQSREVSVPSMDIVLEEGFDLTASGSWFIHFDRKNWLKHRVSVYPDKSKRTRAVSDAQDTFKSNLDAYVIAALQSGFYSQGRGAGVTLSDRVIFKYIAVSFKDGEYCRLYVNHSDKQYILELFPDLDDETAAATIARTSMVTQLAIIDAAAKTGGFYE